METTAKKKTPFYQIIIDDILAQIAAGSFSYDQPICTENSLIEQYGFSRITVRRAMTELENRGILYRKRGVGSFVCHPEELAPALPETSSSPAGKLFAFVFPFHVSKTGLTDAFQAASDYLLSKGCYSSIYIADEREDKTGRSILENLLSMNVAGVAYYPRTSHVHLELLNQFLFSGRSVVVMDVPSTSPCIPSVLSDNLSGRRMLTEHLIALGHTNIAYLSGISPSDRLTIGERLSGYMLALSAHKIPIHKEWIRTDIKYEKRLAPLSDPNSLRSILKELVNEGVTAVLAEHDSFAHDILLCCLDVGISVPQTLNVCGFDNSEWASALSNNNPSFSITTIAQDQAAIGKDVAKLLYNGVGAPITQAQTVTVPVRLIEGNTTGPAPIHPNSSIV